VNKIIVALDTMNLGKVLFLAYADGSVEYRDRLTMAETFNDGDLDRVWHLSQIGFSYPDDEPCAYSLPINITLIELTTRRPASRPIPKLLLSCADWK
jgi:hypothetical protein